MEKSTNNIQNNEQGENNYCEELFAEIHLF